MKVRCFALLAATTALLFQSGLVADGPTSRSPKEALQPFNSLIGTWRGTGAPNGTKEEQQRGFWVENIAWEWQFKDKDAWLSVNFEKSKHFTKGSLRFVPDKNNYVLTLVTLNKEELTFTGEFDGKTKVLILESAADAKMEVQRVVITLLHDNRYLYRLDKKKADRTSFTNVFKVGATKEGVAFAEGTNKPECIVSGGLGTMQVMHMGKTYYVCCSGCAAEFRAEPARYVKEYEDKLAKKDKK